MISEDGSHRERVGDIRLAASALLPVVGLFSVVIGAANLLDLFNGEVAREFGAKNI